MPDAKYAEMPEPFHRESSQFGWPDLWRADQMRAYFDLGWKAGCKHGAWSSRPAARSGISDAAVQALESIAAMTFDRWSEGYRAGQIAIAALDKLRVQTTEWGPAPVGNEADEPMSLADRLDLMADAQAAGSTAQSDLYAAATVWRKHLRGQPYPELKTDAETGANDCADAIRAGAPPDTLREAGAVAGGAA